jgi:hypothetical protein
MKMNVEHWWNRIDMGKTKYPETNLNATVFATISYGMNKPEKLKLI